VLVDAVENTGPREETVRLKYGGINVPKSVDTAPSVVSTSPCGSSPTVSYRRATRRRRA